MSERPARDGDPVTHWDGGYGAAMTDTNLNEALETVREAMRHAMAEVPEHHHYYSDEDALYDAALAALSQIEARVGEAEHERDALRVAVNPGGQMFDAMADLQARLAQAEAALRAVDREVGHGSGDIVEANTMLGRIRTVARTYSTEEGS